MVEVEDDGRGIDVDKVRALAAERANCRRRKRLRAMNDEEVIDLIFAAGFSTAERSPICRAGVWA